MIQPTHDDLDHAVAYALENRRLGTAAADPAEKHGRYVQATQALANASRIMAALTKAAEPPTAPRTLPLNMPAASAHSLLG